MKAGPQPLKLTALMLDDPGDTELYHPQLLQIPLWPGWHTKGHVEFVYLPPPHMTTG